MIEKFLDPYELKARIAPGLILALPVLVAAFYAAPVLSSWPMFAASGPCGFALIYALGHLARARGKAIEPELKVDGDRDSTLREWGVSTKD